MGTFWLEKLKNSKERKSFVRSADFYHQDFLNYLRLANRSPRTIESYDRDLRTFLAWCKFFRLKRLEKIRPYHLSEYLHYLHLGGTLERSFLGRKKEVIILQGPLSVSSRRRHFSTLKNFFSYLLEKYPKKKWIPVSGFHQNPVLSKIHAIRLKDEDVKHTPLLKEKEWEVIEELPMRPKDKLLLSLMYWGGLRLSEVRNLTKDQLDLETGALTLFRKGGKRHQLYLRDQGQILNLWEKVSFKKRGPHLFTHGLSSQPLTRRAAFKKVKKIFQRAGLPPHLSPHSLRKACATRLYRQTKDLLFVRDYLGHSDAKVTQTYIEVRPDDFENVSLEKPLLGSESLRDLQYLSNEEPPLGERLF